MNRGRGTFFLEKTYSNLFTNMIQLTVYSGGPGQRGGPAGRGRGGGRGGGPDRHTRGRPY